VLAELHLPQAVLAVSLLRLEFLARLTIPTVLRISAVAAAALAAVSVVMVVVAAVELAVELVELALSELLVARVVVLGALVTLGATRPETRLHLVVAVVAELVAAAVLMVIPVTQDHHQTPAVAVAVAVAYSPELGARLADEPTLTFQPAVQADHLMVAAVVLPEAVVELVVADGALLAVVEAPEVQVPQVARLLH
jgi:hypothetical protein